MPLTSFVFMIILLSIFPFFVLAFSDSSSLSCHFWPFAEIVPKIRSKVRRQVWKSLKRYFIGLRKRCKARPVGFEKRQSQACVTRSRCHVQLGMQNAAFACAALRRAAPVTGEN